MVEGLVKAVLEFLRLAPRYLAVVLIASAALLFGPPSFLESIGMKETVIQVRPWIGGAFLSSAAVCCVSLSIWLWAAICKPFRSAGYRRRVYSTLQSLTEGEKQILRYYIAENTRSNTLRIQDGTVNRLVGARILYRSANLGDILDGFDHNISEIAWNYLHKHPSLLQGSTNTYRTDKRPSFW